MNAILCLNSGEEKEGRVLYLKDFNIKGQCSMLVENNCTATDILVKGMNMANEY